MSNLLELKGVHTHIGAYHILHGVDLDVPRGRAHHAAGPQRRRQDDHAAHDHGPVAGVAGHASRSAARTSLAGRGTPADRAARHRLRAREHGHLRRPHGQGEHAAGRARRAHAPKRSTTPRLEWIFCALPGAWRSSGTIPAGKLSGGQKQMLAVSRAIVEPRELLLIDEPSKGLAPAIINNMITPSRELKASGVTILLVEQNIDYRQAPGRPRGRDGQRPRGAQRRHGGARARRGAAAVAAGAVAGRINEHGRDSAGRSGGDPEGPVRLEPARAGAVVIAIWCCRFIG